MKFTLKKNDPLSQARAGVIETDHGAIETPIFMPRKYKHDYRC